LRRFSRPQLAVEGAVLNGFRDIVAEDAEEFYPRIGHESSPDDAARIPGKFKWGVTAAMIDRMDDKSDGLNALETSPTADSINR